LKFVVTKVYFGSISFLAYNFDKKEERRKDIKHLLIYLLKIL